jgi:hypothetical protein
MLYVEKRIKACFFRCSECGRLSVIDGCRASTTPPPSIQAHNKLQTLLPRRRKDYGGLECGLQHQLSVKTLRPASHHKRPSVRALFDESSSDEDEEEGLLWRAKTLGNDFDLRYPLDDFLEVAKR